MEDASNVPFNVIYSLCPLQSVASRLPWRGWRDRLYRARRSGRWPACSPSTAEV